MNVLTRPFFAYVTAGVEVVVLVAAILAVLLTRFGTYFNYSPEGRPVLLLFLLSGEAAVFVSVAELLNPIRSRLAQVPFMLMLLLSICWFSWGFFTWMEAGSPNVSSFVLVGLAGTAWVFYLASRYKARP